MKNIYIILLIVLSSHIKAQNIQDARNQGVGQTVTVTGIVTNGQEFGIIRYIEDSSAGIAIYDQAQTYMSNVVRGDSITVTGLLVDYNGLMEINPVNNLIFHSQNNNLPIPQIITPNQIGESTESELSRINNVVFDNAGGTFSGNSTEGFTSSGQNGIIFIKTGSPLENTLIPSSYVDIIGISSQYSFTGSGGYQLLPRDTNDIIPQTSIYLISPVTQSNINNTSFDLSWNTNINGSTNYKIGLNPNNLTDYNIAGNNNTSHNVTINNLSPATIYYIQCYSINNLDTAFSALTTYSTSSNSSGIIQVYFNNSVDNSVADGIDAQNISNAFNDTIAALINKAQTQLDICVYNHANSVIETAINDAYNRGVNIRYITCESTSNLALGNINANINVLKRPNGQGIMHNKFIIIDPDSTNNSYVLSGSTNWTSGNLFDDYNNMIIIQDEALAKAYELEFNEMWGSDSLLPNLNNAKFGSNKLNNTPHKFIINNKSVELYFSPSDNVTSKISSAIETAADEINFALLAFTKDEIADAIINMAPVTSKGIIEQANNTGSEYQNLINAGVNVMAHYGNSPSTDHVLHHKYCIIDGKDSQYANTAKVLTGSHNWSAAAENYNDENTIIIHDFLIANQYFQEFTSRFNKLINNIEITESLSAIQISPNPTSGIININTDLKFNMKLFYNGQIIQEKENVKKLDLSKLNSGIYTILFNTTKGIEVKKIIKY